MEMEIKIIEENEKAIVYVRNPKSSAWLPIVSIKLEEKLESIILQGLTVNGRTKSHTLDYINLICAE